MCESLKRHEITVKAGRAKICIPGVTFERAMSKLTWDIKVCSLPEQLDRWAIKAEIGGDFTRYWNGEAWVRLYWPLNCKDAKVYDDLDKAVEEAERLIETGGVQCAKQ